MGVNFGGSWLEICGAWVHRAGVGGVRRQPYQQYLVHTDVHGDCAMDCHSDDAEHRDMDSATDTDIDSRTGRADRNRHGNAAGHGDRHLAGNGGSSIGDIIGNAIRHGRHRHRDRDAYLDLDPDAGGSCGAVFFRSEQSDEPLSERPAAG